MLAFRAATADTAPAAGAGRGDAMSRRPAFLGLALLASLLASAIMLELDTAQPTEDQTGIVPIRHVARTQPHAASEDPEDHSEQWVAVALARPLFSRDRKPTPVVAKADGGPALSAVPRLTGIVIGPLGRTAIFAGAEGAKPIAVDEGGTIGPFTVRTVSPDRVTVAGPDGEQEVGLIGSRPAHPAIVAILGKFFAHRPSAGAGLKNLTWTKSAFLDK